jgi:hypothetical protein
MHKQLSSSSQNLKATKQPPTFHLASSHNRLFRQAITSVTRRLSNKESQQKLEVQTCKVHKKFQRNLQAQNLGSHRALSIIIKCKSEEPKRNMAKRRMRWVLVFSRNPQTLNELNPRFMSGIFKTLIGHIRY